MRISDFSARLILMVLLLLSAAMPAMPVSAEGYRPEMGWDGTWHTRWTIMEYGGINTYEFDMVFTRSGSQVTGTSDFYNWGLTGTASGNNLTGRWSNNMSDPQQHPHTFGQINFTLDPAGRTFSGLFKGEYHYQWDPRFIVTGTRTDSVTPQPIPPEPIIPTPPPYVPPTPYIPPEPTPPAPAPMPVIPPTPYVPPTPTPVTPPPSFCQFTGIWDTDFGDLSLTQNGDKLTGTYSYQGGRVEGTVNGNTATGTWSEAPSYLPPNDAGDFIFTIQPSCSSFKGEWRYGSCDWDGNINGTRSGQPTPAPVPPAPVPTPVNPGGPWADEWQSPYGLMTLTQSGSQVSGTYEHQSGRLTGAASGNTLKGWWSEAPTHNLPDDAGEMELTMSADSQSFTGRWRYDSTGSWSDNWNGTRKGLSKGTSSSLSSPCDWTGTWKFDWSDALNLSQSGSRVTGSYFRPSWNLTGYIDGTLSGSTLSGTWVEKDQTGKIEWTISSDCNSFTGRRTMSLSPGAGWYDMYGPGTRVTQPQPSPQPLPQPVNPGWGGMWNTDWGTMEISLAGDKTGGTYTTNNGKLDGIINGNNFSGSWAKSPTYAPPNDAGSFLLIMSPDGNSFMGDWKYSACPWTGPWDGTLKGSEPTPSPAPSPAPSPTPQPPPVPPSPSPTPSPTPGVNRPPLASFYIDPQLPTTGVTASFISQSSDPDGDILSYSWIRDGSPLNECANQPRCNWYNPTMGTHIVTLVVNDGKGGQTPFQTQVNITAGPFPPPTPVPPTPVPPSPIPPSPSPTPAPVSGVNNSPKAAFTFDPPQPQVGQDVQIISQSSDTDGDKLNYSWRLDGQLLTQPAGQAKWKWKVPAGGHVMQLEVTDGRGGRDTISRKIKGAGGTVPDSSAKKWKLGPLSCFIATAAYGSQTAAELDTLRAFRDRVLMTSGPGRWAVETYYHLSPPLAEYIADHEDVRAMVREGLLDPVVRMLKDTRSSWDRNEIYSR